MPNEDDEEEIPKAELDMILEQDLGMGIPKRPPAQGITAMGERITYLKAQLARELELFGDCKEQDVATFLGYIEKTKQELRAAEASLAQYQLQAKAQN